MDRLLRERRDDAAVLGAVRTATRILPALRPPASEVAPEALPLMTADRKRILSEVCRCVQRARRAPINLSSNEPVPAALASTADESAACHRLLREVDEAWTWFDHTL